MYWDILEDLSHFWFEASFIQIFYVKDLQDKQYFEFDLNLNKVLPLLLNACSSICRHDSNFGEITFSSFGGDFFLSLRLAILWFSCKVLTKKFCPICLATENL